MEQMLQQMQGMGGMNAFANMGPKALVEFKAGKMNYDGKMVTPDRRKGTLRVVEDAGGMKQFQWCEQDAKDPAESFYVFPDDAKFEKVKQSKDRVYLLEMKHTQQRYFYWMQDDDEGEEKDKENALKVHNCLNNIKMPGDDKPGTAQSQSNASEGPSMTSQNPGMQSQQDMMNQFLQQMQNEANKKKEDSSPSLPAIVTHDALTKLIEDDEDGEIRKALVPHLPEGQQTNENLRENLLSPQLRQAMSTLTQAIQSDQAELILASCGLDTAHMTNATDGMEALINALMAKYEGEKKD